MSPRHIRHRFHLKTGRFTYLVSVPKSVQLFAQLGPLYRKFFFLVIIKIAGKLVHFCRRTLKVQVPQNEVVFSPPISDIVHDLLEYLLPFLFTYPELKVYSLGGSALRWFVQCCWITAAQVALLSHFQTYLF